MTLSCFVVDAFTSQVFSGNPAAIVPLDSWLPDSLLQAIAAEHNLSETAFLVEKDGQWRIRWFTPQVEVDLCGHATLAAAYVLAECLGRITTRVTFQSRSGPLGVGIGNGLYTLDFPSRPPEPVAPDKALLSGLNAQPLEVLAARDYLVRFATAAEVRNLAPLMSELRHANRFAVIATAPADPQIDGPDIDFVSRFFAPAQGVDEDPVTGSAHSTLIPYWAAQLGKSKLRAKQISRRTGHLYCELSGERVLISGHATLFSRNQIYIPG
jgi:PhzF family phenazine biosynthesis protein